MATVYIHPTLGDDTRSYTTAQTPGTPWKTPMRAHNGPTVDGDVVRIGRPGDGELTWSNIDAVLDSMGASGSAANVSKRLTWLVSADVQANFITETGAAYLPGKYGTAQDSEGSPTHPVLGHCWRLINPKVGSLFYFNTESNASVNFDQTGTKPDEVDGGYSSCIYLVNKGAQAGTSGRINIYGLTITRFDGNGVMYKDVPPGYLDYFDISHTMTGIRYEGAACDGKGQATQLNGAVSAGATTITVDSTANFLTGDLVRIGSGALDRDTEYRLVTVTSATVLTLQPGPSNRPGLHYPHADNAEVSQSYGARFGRTHHNDMYGQIGAGGFGAEGVSFNKLPANVMLFRVQSDANYGWLEHIGFGVDGGAATPYAQGVGCGATESVFFDSHSLLESGTDRAAYPTYGTQFIWTFNQSYGKIDQQALYGNSPTAAIIHARCVEGWLVRRNTFVITNGNTTNGGLRWSRTGSSTYEGGIDNYYFCENIIWVGYATSYLIDHDGDFAFPASSTINRNIWYRGSGFSSTNLARHHTGGTVYTATEAGRALYEAATGFENDSKWQVDPLLTSPLTGDLRLQAGSPAIGMAANGDAIGALDYVSTAAEDAPAVAASGTGTAGQARVNVQPNSSPPSGTGTAGAISGGLRQVRPKAGRGRSGRYSAQAGDDFERAVVASGLGTSTSGYTWSVNTINPGGSGLFRTTGTRGEAFINLPAQQHGAVLVDAPTFRDGRATLRWSIDKLPQTDLIELWLWLRMGAGPFLGGYGGHMIIFPTTINGNFNWRTTDNNRTAVLPSTPVPGAPALAVDIPWVMEFECLGANPTELRMKIYRESDGPPGTWTFITTDSAGPQTAGLPGVGFRMDTGTTNPPYTFGFDDVTYDQVNHGDGSTGLYLPAIYASAVAGASNPSIIAEDGGVPAISAGLTMYMGPDESGGGGGGGGTVPPNPISGLTLPEQTMWRTYWQNADQANVDTNIAALTAMNQGGVLLMGKEWGETNESLPANVSDYLDDYIAAGIEPWLACWIGKLDPADDEAGTCLEAWAAGEGKWAGIVLDSEVQWKNKVAENEATAHTHFDAFFAELKATITSAPIMYSTYGVPTFHQLMRYEWWNEECDACLAQIYFGSGVNTSQADYILDRAMESWADISVGWAVALKPIVPTMNAYSAGADPVERQAYGERAIAERGHLSTWKYPIENPDVAEVLANL